jgi:hypothetical protein
MYSWGRHLLYSRSKMQVKSDRASGITGNKALPYLGLNLIQINNWRFFPGKTAGF